MNTPIKSQLTLDNLTLTLDQMIANGMKPGIIFADYLQIMEHPDNRLTRTQQVTENIFNMKIIGQSYKVPVVFTVQAGREVDERTGVRWPQIGDAQWASIIEQTVDVMIGITRPIQYIDEGKMIKHKGRKGVYEFPVTKNLMGVNIIKQRQGEVGIKRFYHFNPSTVDFTELNDEEMIMSGSTDQQQLNWDNIVSGGDLFNPKDIFPTKGEEKLSEFDFD